MFNEYFRSICSSDISFNGQLVPGFSGQYCYCFGTGKGPRVLNGEKVIELEHDMKDSCDMVAQVMSVARILRLNFSLTSDLKIFPQFSAENLTLTLDPDI